MKRQNRFVNQAWTGLAVCHRLPAQWPSLLLGFTHGSTRPATRPDLPGHGELLATQRANPYRVRAYRNAADAILSVTGDLTDLAARHELQNIPGIGKDLAGKIEEFLSTGTIRAYEELRTPLPEEVAAWAALPGLSDALVSYVFQTQHPHLDRSGIPGCVPPVADATRIYRIGRSIARGDPSPAHTGSTYAAGRSSLKIFHVLSNSTAFCS